MHGSGEETKETLRPESHPAITTKACSGEDRQDILVDGGADGEVRSETG